MTSTAPLADSDQSSNRSLGGVLVHVLGLFTSFVGPLIMYIVSNHEFTRENARNALNWHFTLAILWTIGSCGLFLMMFFVGDDATSNGEPIGSLPVPSSLETVFAFVVIILALVLLVTALATLVYAVVGTLKAVFGSVWSYPGAIDIIGRL